MPIEIERKFLVKSDTFKSLAYSSKHIVQGFLNKDPERTVRIRINEDKAFLTVKGLSSDDGLSRFEWEKEIPVDEAKDLLTLCDHNLIEKRRYLVKHENHIIEVDEFYGRLKGLVIAEVELQSKTEKFNVPNWLGEEVTGNVNYYNSNL
jgi:CYTH domain-containing protein